jgi:hypothetical protein
VSGGSFNYLCYADVDELFNRQSDLIEIANALEALDYAEDAMQETDAIRQEMQDFIDNLTDRLDRIRPVWKALEWWHSCDSSEETLKQALATYRGAGT